HAWQNLFDECKARGLLGAELMDADKGIFQSETREIRLDSRRLRFQAVSPATEVFSIDGKGAVKGRVVSVENRAGYSLIAVTAMSPGKSLADSEKLLLFFLSDVRATGLSTDEAPIKEYQYHGSLPHLVRVSRAEVTLDRCGFSELSLAPLGMNGRTSGVSLIKASGESFVVPVSTDYSEGGSLVYEIIRKVRP
ncbi:MAG: hypothetical protein JNM63_11780, partial [Spirochaetia bacterium]|nr:hypothetical protein [Spirochaetia bacterium]